MKPRMWSLLACLLAFAAVAAGPRDTTVAGKPAPAAARGVTAAGKAARVKSVTLLVGSRVFADFKEVDTAPLQKEFPVGTSDYTARVVEYIPDFAIDTKKNKVVSRSSQPNNPAVRVIVREKGVPKDTSWAFANFPPHYSRRSLLSFRLLRVEFFDAPPIHVEFDTTGLDTARTRKPR